MDIDVAVFKCDILRRVSPRLFVYERTSGPSNDHRGEGEFIWDGGGLIVPRCAFGDETLVFGDQEKANVRLVLRLVPGGRTIYLSPYSRRRAAEEQHPVALASKSTPPIVCACRTIYLWLTEASTGKMNADC